MSPATADCAAKRHAVRNYEQLYSERSTQLEARLARCPQIWDQIIVKRRKLENTYRHLAAALEQLQQRLQQRLLANKGCIGKILSYQEQLMDWLVLPSFEDSSERHATATMHRLSQIAEKCVPVYPSMQPFQTFRQPLGFLNIFKFLAETFFFIETRWIRKIRLMYCNNGSFFLADFDRVLRAQVGSVGGRERLQSGPDRNRPPDESRAAPDQSGAAASETTRASFEPPAIPTDVAVLQRRRPSATLQWLVLHSQHLKRIGSRTVWS